MFLERAQKKLEQFGEVYTVGDKTYKGIFKPLDSGTTNIYLDTVQLMGVTKPGLALITTADVVINVNDTITRDERVYTVLKTASHRIAGTVVLKLAILA